MRSFQPVGEDPPLAEVILKSAKSNANLVTGFSVHWTKFLQEFRLSLLATVLCLKARRTLSQTSLLNSSKVTLWLAIS